MRKSQRKIKKMDPETMKIEVWKGSGALAGGLGGPWELFREVLADFAQFGPGSDRRNLAQKGQDGAKMVQGQDDHLEAIWEAILRSLGGLGGEHSKKQSKCKKRATP